LELEDIVDVDLEYYHDCVCNAIIPELTMNEIVDMYNGKYPKDMPENIKRYLREEIGKVLLNLLL